MNNNKYSRKPKSNKGFYIALGICVIAIGVAAFFSYSDVGVSTKNNSSVSSQTDNDAAANLDRQVQNNLTSSYQASSQTSDAPSSKSSSSEASSAQVSSIASSKSEAKQTVAEQETLFMYPVSKNVTKSYSDGGLVYSLTMNDWRVHNGTDFAAQAGSIVKSMADGVVKEINNDQSLGKTIVIEHPDGITAYYSGLGETVLVQVNENVTVGKDIGSIKSVPCEVLEENHLHLGIKKDGAFIDPMTIIQYAQESSQDSQSE